MLVLNKKYYLILIGFLVGFFYLAAVLTSVQAAGIFRPQVKLADKPAVYFLSRKYHLKKAYINSNAYLSYGNHWSDIKIVSATYLATWPEARLFRAFGTPNIYYIKGQQKTLIQRPADLVKFKLIGVPVLAVSRVDLAQYQTRSYSDLGLERAVATPPSKQHNKNNSNPPPVSSSLRVFNDLVAGINNNALVPGTNDNLLGVFRFKSSSTATLSSLSLNLTGVYNNQVINSIKVHDLNNVKYDANVNWRSNDRQIIVNFRPPLNLKSGESRTVKILVNLNTCANCANQTMHLDLPLASDVKASLPASAAWPLRGTQFTLVSNSNVLGKIQAQLNKLASSSLVVTSGSRLISKLSLSEVSGNEDVIIKELTFDNNGSANLNDWHNFSLWADNQLIARQSVLDSQGQIVFNINYLRVVKSGTINLKVIADLISGYNPQDTYNLQLINLRAVGQVYSLVLSPSINNINESFTLN